MSTSLHSPFGSMMDAYAPVPTTSTSPSTSNSTSTSTSTSFSTSIDTEQATAAFGCQFFSLLALVYMSVCMYWSLFRMNLGWAFTLQGPQQSPPSSLIFNAEYFSRLQFPLGFNFLLVLNAPK